MKLKYKNFDHQTNLCDWVNENPDSVNIHAITIDSFGEFVLFYSIETTSNNKIDFNADDFFNDLRNKKA